MRSRNNQQGFLTFTGVLMLVVIGAFFFAAIKLGPPYVANYQFQDAITNIARTATYSTINEEAIRKEVMTAARDAGVTLEPSQVKASRTREDVSIAVEYSVTVDMLVQPVTLRFSPSAGNRLITAK